jgi:hypothetical protein
VNRWFCRFLIRCSIFYQVRRNAAVALLLPIPYFSSFSRQMCDDDDGGGGGDTGTTDPVVEANAYAFLVTGKELRPSCCTRPRRIQAANAPARKIARETTTVVAAAATAATVKQHVDDDPFGFDELDDRGSDLDIARKSRLGPAKPPTRPLPGWQWYLFFPFFFIATLTACAHGCSAGEGVIW